MASAQETHAPNIQYAVVDTQKLKMPHIVGFTFLGIIISIMLLCVVIYIRKRSITLKKIKKQIRNTFASTI
jgi:hypothetical protein